MKILKISKQKVDGAAVVVMCGDHLLLLKRCSDAEWMPNKWNLPGGTIEKGESRMEAALRECEEESGISLDSAEHFGTYGRLDVFLAKIDSKEVSINFESSDYAWVKLEEVEDYETTDPTAEVVKDLISSV